MIARQRLTTVFVLVLSIMSFSALNAKATPNEKATYIVKFSDEVLLGNEIAATRASGVQVEQVLENIFKGFVGKMNESQAAALARRPQVDLVEKDSNMSIFTEQLSPPWGLDRIDQKGATLDLSYKYSSTGSGISAYVVDTGIRSTHSEISGRVALGYSALADKSTEDCNGHGTHVAATIGGSTYGVAKSVTLIPVRVLDCNGSGSVSGIVSGLNWIAGVRQVDKAVANMSLGGGISRTLDSAVSSLIKKGVVVVVAAGNSNHNACNFSPARVASAVTVGATDSTNTRASFSNFGSCLDIFAPGVNIISATSSSDSAVAYLSGTSMATPHVAGVVARFLSTPGSSASQASSVLTSEATQGVVKNPGTNSPNRLLFRDPQG